jgi:hypothetical protein
MLAVTKGLRARWAAACLVTLLWALSASAQTSGQTTDLTGPGPSPSPSPAPGATPPPPGNPAPVIQSLTATQVAGKKFRFRGTVSDNTPASCVVVFSGATSGVAMCNGSGQFDGTFAVETLGQVTATANDGTQNSQPVSTTLTNAAPTVTNFTAVQGPNNTWTFSGKVNDEAPAGLSVILSGPPGVNGQTATVLANGLFSVTVTLPPTSCGFVTATVADWYGATGSAQTYFGS